MNIDQNITLLIQENVFENVLHKMAAILFSPLVVEYQVML